MKLCNPNQESSYLIFPPYISKKVCFVTLSMTYEKIWGILASTSDISSANSFCKKARRIWLLYRCTFLYVYITYLFDTVGFLYQRLPNSFIKVSIGYICYNIGLVPIFFFGIWIPVMKSSHKIRLDCFLHSIDGEGKWKIKLVSSWNMKIKVLCWKRIHIILP